MSTVTEIANVLPKLSDEELQQVERALHDVYRQRHTGILYDDAYGVWTEDDQTAAARQVFAMLDKAEQKAKPTGKP